MSDKRKVFYKKEFEEDFEKIYDYISIDSEKNARNFARDTKEKIEWIIDNPTSGTPEKQIHSKQNWYRFKTVMKSWKIIYKVTKTILVFLAIIHTKRHPKEVKKLRTKNYD